MKIKTITLTKEFLTTYITFKLTLDDDVNISSGGVIKLIYTVNNNNTINKSFYENTASGWSTMNDFMNDIVNKERDVLNLKFDNIFNFNLLSTSHGFEDS